MTPPPATHQPHPSGLWRNFVGWARSFYVPPLIVSPGLTAMVIIAAVAAALTRGMDYAFLPQRADLLTDVELAAPISVWGLGLVTTSMFAGTGWLLRRWPFAIFGHASLAGIYTALAAGMVMDGFYDPWGAGLRNGLGILLTPAVIHVVLTVLAWREWDRARRQR